uniref:Uncharacterized protein n=1 Tax=Rhizophora mucronata TaxID=61149 RepID=A0A2P2N8K8_RHIMU
MDGDKRMIEGRVCLPIYFVNISSWFATHLLGFLKNVVVL